MITSLFSYIRPHITKDYKIENLNQLLFDCGCEKTFRGIVEDYGVDAEKVITYLIFVYSFDSTFIVAGDDWRSTKVSIMELVGLDAELFKEVIDIKKQSVKSAILYLSKEIKDYRYAQIIVWKESCQILDQIATTQPDAKNKSGAKNIGDSNKFSFETKRKIESLEKEVMQTTKSKDRLQEVQGLNLESLSMERLLKEISKS